MKEEEENNNGGGMMSGGSTSTLTDPQSKTGANNNSINKINTNSKQCLTL